MAVQLVFVVTQHVRDQKLLEGLIDYIGCGRYSKRKEAGDFKVLSIADINKKIIPFFSEYQLQGVKSQNFADFRSVAQIMEAKGHLTTEGLEQIQAIKMGMNKGRVS
jgi:LAGLIDADG endonuclease